MAITKLNRHDNCEVQAIKGPFGPHYAKLICKTCNTGIQWLSRDDFFLIQGTYINNNNNTITTYNDH